jgi:acetyl esterase/lipase
MSISDFGERPRMKVSMSKIFKFFMVIICLCNLDSHIFSGQNLTVEDILNLPVSPADFRIPYGEDPLQFGDLRLPKGDGPHPVVIVIHGGCWRAKYNLDHVSSFCAALTKIGLATWSLEYRRLGNPGGGWPGTFIDVARGTDFLQKIALKHSVDLGRIIAVGHSAGGHLALWLAVRPHLPVESLLYSGQPLPLEGVISLAGVVDLRKGETLGACGDALNLLVGGSSVEVPDRYQQASPAEFLPIGIPQRLIVGERDNVMLKLGRIYEATAKKTGDDVQLTVIEGAAHFELIAPETASWTVVKNTILSLLEIE